MPPSWPKQDQAQNLDAPTWGSLWFFRGITHSLWTRLWEPVSLYRDRSRQALLPKLPRTNKEAANEAYGDNRPLTNSDWKELKTLLISQNNQSTCSPSDEAVYPNKYLWALDEWCRRNSCVLHNPLLPSRKYEPWASTRSYCWESTSALIFPVHLWDVFSLCTP